MSTSNLPTFIHLSLVSSHFFPLLQHATLMFSLVLGARVVCGHGVGKAAKSLEVFVAVRRVVASWTSMSLHLIFESGNMALQPSSQPASINRPNKNAKNGKLNLTVSFSWMRLGCWWWWWRWRWRLKLCSFCKSRDPRSMNFFLCIVTLTAPQRIGWICAIALAKWNFLSVLSKQSAKHYPGW